MIEHVEQARQAIAAAKYPTGMHVMTAEQASRRIQQGMQFVAVSSDLGMLNQQANQVVKALGLTAGQDIARY